MTAVWTDEEGTWVEFASTLPALTCFNCANEYSDWAWIERDEAGNRHVYECGWCDAPVYIPDDPVDERCLSGRWTRTLAYGGAHPKSPTLTAPRPEGTGLASDLSTAWQTFVDFLDPQPDPYVRDPVGWVRDRFGEFMWSQQRCLAQPATWPEVAVHADPITDP